MSAFLMPFSMSARQTFAPADRLAVEPHRVPAGLEFPDDLVTDELVEARVGDEDARAGPLAGFRLPRLLVADQPHGRARGSRALRGPAGHRDRRRRLLRIRSLRHRLVPPHDCRAVTVARAMPAASARDFGRCPRRWRGKRPGVGRFSAEARRGALAWPGPGGTAESLPRPRLTPCQGSPEEAPRVAHVEPGRRRDRGSLMQVVSAPSGFSRCRGRGGRDGDPRGSVASPCRLGPRSPGRRGADPARAWMAYPPSQERESREIGSQRASCLEQLQDRGRIGGAPRARPGRASAARRGPRQGAFARCPCGRAASALRRAAGSRRGRDRAPRPPAAPRSSRSAPSSAGHAAARAGGSSSNWSATELPRHGAWPRARPPSPRRLARVAPRAASRPPSYEDGPLHVQARPRWSRLPRSRRGGCRGAVAAFDPFLDVPVAAADVHGLAGHDPGARGDPGLGQRRQDRGRGRGRQPIPRPQRSSAAGGVQHDRAAAASASSSISSRFARRSGSSMRARPEGRAPAGVDQRLEHAPAHDRGGPHRVRQAGDVDHLHHLPEAASEVADRVRDGARVRDLARSPSSASRACP